MLHLHPGTLQRLHALRVAGDGDGVEVVGREPPAKSQRSGGQLVHLRDEEHHGGLGTRYRHLPQALQLLGTLRLQEASHPVVVTAHRVESGDEHRHRDQDDVGPVGELGHHHHEGDNAGQEGSEAVHGGTPAAIPPSAV